MAIAAQRAVEANMSPIMTADERSCQRCQQLCHRRYFIVWVHARKYPFPNCQFQSKEFIPNAYCLS